MRSFATTFVVLSISLMSQSCEIDNYDAPSETLKGTLFDATTREPLSFEQGSSNTRIRLDEISWGETATPQYLNVKQDGTYQHTKMFRGKYKITPTDGPFIPVVIRNTSTGVVLEDNSVTTEVKGQTNVDFYLEPFLRINLLEEPYLNASNQIVVKFKIAKGNSSINFSIPAFLDCQLFLANTPYAGNNNYESSSVGSVVRSYEGKSGDAMLGEEITITSRTLKSGRNYYLRVGARVNDTYRKYNYSEVKHFTTE